MPPKGNATRHIPAASKTGWVPISLMDVCEYAQRPLRVDHVDRMLRNFDPDKLGVMVVSKRDGVFWILDGQHRRQVMIGVGWGDQQAFCEIYEGLTIPEEAEIFLGRNHRLNVTPLANFKVSVTAGRTAEVQIDKIVRSLDLAVGSGTGRVQAVGTLLKIYEKLGPDILARALLVAYQSFGVPGIEAAPIEAVAMVLHRYGPDITDESAITRLKQYPGGIGSIMTTARQTKATLGYPLTQCVANAVVRAFNKPRGKRLPVWFREDQAEAV